MASGTKIRGITLQIGADTSKLTEGLQNVNKDLKETDRTLRDIEKGLKLDPKNAELLAQKTKYLNEAIEQTKTKLKEQEKILTELEDKDGGTGKYAKQIDAVKRDIEETRQKQEQYKEELEKTETATENLGNAADKAADQQQDLGKSFEDAAIKVELLKAGAELAAKAIGAMIDYIGDAIRASAEYADNILTLSTVTGLSTDALQEYQYMAELMDVSLDTITGSLSKLTKQMYSAKDGTGTAAEYFEALGVSVTDSNGELRDSNEVFAEAIAALGQIGNDTERDAIAMGLFGKSAQDLNPMIQTGAEGMEAFRQEAHDMGYVLDTEALGSLGAMDDSFQRLTLASDTLKNQIGLALAPVITTVIEGAVALMQWATPMITGLIQGIITFCQGFMVFIEGMKQLWDNIWDGIVQAVEGAKQALQPIIDGISNFFTNLGGAIDGVVGKISDFVGAIAGAIGKAGEFLSGGFGKVASFFGFGGGGSGGFGPSSMATFTRPAYASGGYSLSTAVTINNYSTPVSGAMADRIADLVNDKLGRMLK